jgi:flagella basal body P-ring formation protein FlgA
MTLRWPLLLSLLTVAMTSPAAEPVRVPAERLVDAARSALRAKAEQAGIVAEFKPVGRVQDLQLPGEGEAQLSTDDWQAPWLRSRVGVPVQVRLSERLRTSATVWFEVSAPVAGEVYAGDFPRGALAATVLHRSGTIDLARTNGEASVSAQALTGHRLRRPVRTGDPVRASDFEPAPAISVQQAVRIEVAQGAVRLTVPARALADGEIGQIISVLPAHASQPVRARIVSSQVVTLEN